MSMRISFGVENLRSIENMETVELCPITVLVGANNSGKSTFLRSLPLLRQSIESRIVEPILWKKKNVVDFGKFESAIKGGVSEKENSDKEIFLKFKLDFKDSHKYVYDFDYITENSNNYDKEKVLDSIAYDVGIKRNQGKILLSSIEIKILNFNLSLKVKFMDDGNELYLNDIIIKDKAIENFHFHNERLFAGFQIDKEYFSNTFKSRAAFEIEYDYLKGDSLVIVNEIYKLLGNFSDKIENSHQILEESIKLAYLYPFNRSTVNELKGKCKYDEIKLIYDLLIGDDRRFNMVKQYAELNLMFYALVNANSDLTDVFMGVHWVGPSRDFSERHSEVLPLDVSELLVNGENLPMILWELKKNGKLKEFSNWCKGLTGFEIEIESSAHQLEICVIKNETKVNLVDSGYGISQVLPILSQIWLNTKGKKLEALPEWNGASENKYFYVLMEQPESHLHPKQQARIADALVDTFEFNEDMKLTSRHSFMVETHSEIIINRLGALIRNGKLPQEYAQIVVFNMREDGTNTTDVTVSTFNEDGTLNNWPYDFFDWSDNLSDF